MPNPFYFLVFFTVLLLTAALTWLVKKLAERYQILDTPSQERKIHTKPTALLGGVAIFVAFFGALYFLRAQILVGALQPHHWIGVFVGGLFLMIGGILDDKYNLKPKQQIIWPLLAIAAVIIGGVNIGKISGLSGGFVYFSAWASIGFIAFWLLGMMYTTKLLDGLDGLVSGITAIGAFIIFLFTITTRYYQPDIALAALILSAACAGFLIFNWHPAKIFLGEGGSLFLGYILGVLAIISGGKIAIALLVMGIPILDLLWTIIRRARAGHNPFKTADRQHLHFRLVDSGLGVRKTVLIYYFLAASFGLCALFVQSRGKLISLGILAAIMAGIIIIFSLLDKKHKNS